MGTEGVAAATVIIPAADVAGLLPMKTCIDAVEKALIGLTAGDYKQVRVCVRVAFLRRSLHCALLRFSSFVISFFSFAL